MMSVHVHDGGSVQHHSKCICGKRIMTSRSQDPRPDKQGARIGVASKGGFGGVDGVAPLDDNGKFLTRAHDQPPALSLEHMKRWAHTGAYADSMARFLDASQPRVVVSRRNVLSAVEVVTRSAGCGHTGVALTVLRAPKASLDPPRLAWPDQCVWRTAIGNAIKRGHVDTAEAMLRHANAGHALLQGAATSMAHWLVCGHSDDDACTLLGYACQFGSATLVRQLLALGADPSQGAKNKSPLILVCGRRIWHNEAAPPVPASGLAAGEAAMDGQRDSFCLNYDGTQLHTTTTTTAETSAFLRQQCETTTLEATHMLTLLIGAGAKVDETSSSGRSPLHVAVSVGGLPERSGRFSLHASTISLAGRRDRCGGPMSMAALVRASTEAAARMAMVETLLRFGADVAALDAEAHSPLHCAAYHGEVPVLRRLLRHSMGFRDDGASTSTPNQQRMVHVSEAGSSGSVDASSCTAFVDTTPTHASRPTADTSSHIGCASNAAAPMSTFETPDVSVTEHYTPDHTCLSAMSRDHVQRMNAQTAIGNTPLRFAVQECHACSVSLLLRCGGVEGLTVDDLYLLFNHASAHNRSRSSAYASPPSLCVAPLPYMVPDIRRRELRLSRVAHVSGSEPMHAGHSCCDEWMTRMAAMVDVDVWPMPLWDSDAEEAHTGGTANSSRAQSWKSTHSTVPSSCGHLHCSPGGRAVLTLLTLLRRDRLAVTQLCREYVVLRLQALDSALEVSLGAGVAVALTLDPDGCLAAEDSTRLGSSGTGAWSSFLVPRSTHASGPLGSTRADVTMRVVKRVQRLVYTWSRPHCVAMDPIRVTWGALPRVLRSAIVLLAAWGRRSQCATHRAVWSRHMMALVVQWLIVPNVQWLAHAVLLETLYDLAESGNAVEDE